MEYFKDKKVLLSVGVAVVVVIVTTVLVWRFWWKSSPKELYENVSSLSLDKTVNDGQEEGLTRMIVEDNSNVEFDDTSSMSSLENELNNNNVEITSSHSSVA
jgi:hypothetical protein